MSKLKTIHNSIFVVTLLLNGCSTPQRYDSIDASRDIQAIIYSDLSKQEMLARLEPYVKIGDKLTQFSKKTGIDPGVCLIGGPGVMDCRPLKGGLNLVADPDGRVQLIRRTEQTVGGREFKEMSISSGLLEWKGYVRGYPN